MIFNRRSYAAFYDAYVLALRSYLRDGFFPTEQGLLTILAERAESEGRSFALQQPGYERIAARMLCPPKSSRAQQPNRSSV